LKGEYAKECKLLILMLGLLFISSSLLAQVSAEDALTAGTVTTSSNNIVCGDTAHLACSAASGGSGSYTYQWQLLDISTGWAWTDISGATTLNYDYVTTVDSRTSNDYHVFRVFVTDSLGHTTTSNNVEVWVEPYPNPTAGTVTTSTNSIISGETAHLTSTAATGGVAPYDYQWQKSDQSTGWNWVDITGATSIGYNYQLMVPQAFSDDHYFRVVVTDSVGHTAVSNEVLVTCNPGGVFVTPEYPLGALAALLSCFAALFVAAKLKRPKAPLMV
jgi:hypothetical protein